MKKIIVAVVLLAGINSLVFAAKAKSSSQSSSQKASEPAKVEKPVDLSEGLSPAELIQLRNEWNAKLLDATRKIAENAPEFELHYYNKTISVADLTESDYERGTITVKVGLPYLKQIKGFENYNLADSLLTQLNNMEASRKWGDKINGFPWSYAQDVSKDNWLLKAITNHTDKYNFVISLVDDKGKVIASKPITYMVCYEKKFSGFVTCSDRNHREFVSNARSFYDIADDEYMPFVIKIEDCNPDKLSIKVEPRGKNTTKIVTDENNGVLSSYGVKYIKYTGSNQYYNAEKGSGKLFIDYSDTYDLVDFYSRLEDRHYKSYEDVMSDIYQMKQKNWTGQTEPISENGIVYIPAGSPLELQQALWAQYQAAVDENNTDKKAQKKKEQMEAHLGMPVDILMEKYAFVKNSINIIAKEGMESVPLQDMPFVIMYINDILSDPKYSELKKNDFSFNVTCDLYVKDDIHKLLIAMGNEIRQADFYIGLRMSYYTKDIDCDYLKGCKSLVSVSSLYAANIPSDAFSGCTKLNYLSIYSAESFGAGVFDGLDSIKTIYLEKKHKKQISKNYKDMVKNQIISFIY